MSDPAPQPSLKRRILKAGGWSIGQMLALHMLRLGSNLIMTRILLPEAFGLMAMVGVIIAGFSLFTDIGIHRSIAREPDGDQDHFLRVAWVVKIGRGAMIAAGVLCSALLLALLAPHFAKDGSVYADPALAALVAISALIPLMMGFESTSKDLAERHLKMHYSAVLEIAAQIIALATMLIFSAISPTVWALMLGMLTGAALKSIGTHFFFPGPRMQFTWDLEIADRLWQYGKWLMGSSFFTFFALNADRFILAALLDATTFGIYVIAQIWVAAGTMLIGRLADKVGFPTISEVIRERPNEVPQLYRKFQNVIDAICLTAFVTLFLCGPFIIDQLYTATYVEAGRYLALLSVGFLTLRYNTHNGLILNLGKSKAIMLISAVRAVTICTILPLSYHVFGIEGALLAVSLTPLVTTPFTLYLLRPVLGSWQIHFDTLWLGATLVIAICVYIWS